MKYNDSIGPCIVADNFRSKYGKISYIEPREIVGTSTIFILPMSFDVTSIENCPSEEDAVTKRIGYATLSKGEA